jgi:hypothetical protein
MVRIPKAVGQGLQDVQVDAAHPHARFGAFFRRGADQALALRADFIEVLTDGRDLGQDHAVIEFQRWQLAGRVLGHVSGLAVFASAQIDFGAVQFDAAFGGKDAHNARVGTN